MIITSVPVESWEEFAVVIPADFFSLWVRVLTIRS